MATSLVNPAATGGTDFGGILSNILSAYTQVSVARVEKETAKYNAAAAIQQQSFNAPQANGFLESFGIGNAVMPGTNSRGVATTSSNLPQLMLLGVAGIAGFFVIKKMVS